MRNNNGDAFALAVLIVGGLLALALIAEFVATYLVVIIAVASLAVLLVALGFLIWLFIRNL